MALSSNHTVAGNPNRFQRREIAIRPDEEWRQSMPATSRALVGALTLPALARHALR